MDFFKRNKTENFSINEFKPRDFPLERKFKDKDKPESDIRWVVGLLLGSVLLSSGFYFWGKYKRNEMIPNKPPIVLNTNPTPTPTLSLKSPAKVLEKVTTATLDLSGTYGLYVYNLTTKQSYGLHQNEVFTAASLMKLPVILTLYQEVEKGNLSLEDKYTLQNADKRNGAGSMQYKPAGTVYTYRQLAELMGKQSDNTAFTAMRRILTDQRIQETILELGMSKTNLKESETTPAEMGLFFRKLYAGSVINREHRDEILSFITKTIYENRIPAGIPEEIEVAHKVGSEIGVFSDGGIVFAPKPFVLVIMTEKALEKEAGTTVVQIAKDVWAFETED